MYYEILIRHQQKRKQKEEKQKTFFLAFFLVFCSLFFVRKENCPVHFPFFY